MGPKEAGVLPVVRVPPVLCLHTDAEARGAANNLNQCVATLQEEDEFLETLRRDLLPRFVDVSPSIESFPDWVGDVPAPEPCFVLELVRQERDAPKSLHFT